MSEAFDPITDTPESSMKLYARKTSSNSQKVLWFLAELGLDYEFVATGGDAGGLRSEAYVAMNPNSKIPTLVDGAIDVWDSVGDLSERVPSANKRSVNQECGILPPHFTRVRFRHAAGPQPSQSVETSHR